MSVSGESQLVIALGPVDDVLVSGLKPWADIVVIDGNDRSALDAALPEAVGLVARGTSVVDARLIDAAPKLRVIGRSGVGVDRVDLRAATRRKIPVVITPGSNTRAVAEGTLALILHLVKRLGRMTALVREGRWNERESIPVGDLDGARLGIVGLGRIGVRLAEIADTMGMRVLASDPYVDPVIAERQNVKMVSLRELAEQSDVICLHAPLTPETRGMFGHDILSVVKRGTILVNTSRGALMDFDATYAALLDGRLAGVGLDVFDPEPPTLEGHPMFSHPDVVMTPHVLGLSARSRRMTFEQLTVGLVAALSGARPRHVANPEIYEE